jgi:hypothetical protein
MFGIRRLGIQGDNLIFERKRFVLRVVERPRPSEADLEEAHGTNTALYVADADDATCRLASEMGVLLITQASGTQEQVVSQIRRLRRWPSVGLLIVDAAIGDAEALKRERLNLLLAQRLPIGELAPSAEWAQVAVWEAGSGDKELTGFSKPVVVCRAAEQSDKSVSELRLECDRLQADLAGAGNFAGYMV